MDFFYFILKNGMQEAGGSNPLGSTMNFQCFANILLSIKPPERGLY